MASRNSNSMARQRGAIKRYGETNHRTLNETSCSSNRSTRPCEIGRKPQSQTRAGEIEPESKSSLDQKRRDANFEKNVQRVSNQEKVSCVSNEEIIVRQYSELNVDRKRSQGRIHELETQIKWQSKKIKMLEKTIEVNNEARLANQLLQQEKLSAVQRDNDRLVRELQAKRFEREQYQSDIQNLENTIKYLQTKNASLIEENQCWKNEREENDFNVRHLEETVKQLHDENILLKETPVRVVVPLRNMHHSEQTFYSYKTNGRSVAPQVSLLDQYASQRIDNSKSQPDSIFPNPDSSSQWPFSASEEDLFWGQ